MYNKIIKEICTELGIKFSILSNGWIYKLEYKDNIKYIAGYKFDLNGHASGEAVDDKYATYEIFKNENIPVIEHKILYNSDNLEKYALKSNSRSIAYEYLSKYNNIVIKSNIGTCGTEVYRANSIEEIDNALDKLFIRNHSVSLCPFYDINCEYRVIILNGNPLLIYGKIRPIIIGDGVKKISELLHEFNPSFHYVIKNDYVLSKGEIYEYTWKHNLSCGSKLSLVINDKDKIKDIAIKAAKAIGLNFGSVDVIEVNNEYMIMECNSGVMMDNFINILSNGYDIAKKVYKEAIKSMFGLE